MFSMKPLDSTNIASTTRSDAAQPAFTLDAQSAPAGSSSTMPRLVGAKNVDSMDEPLDPSARQRMDFCEYRYNEIMIKLAEIEEKMTSSGSVDWEENITDADKRLKLLKDFDDLMELIDGFFDACRDFMPAEAVADIRGVRVDAERLRRALLIEDNDPNPLATVAERLGTTARGLASVFSDGFSALAGSLLAIGAWLSERLVPTHAH